MAVVVTEGHHDAGWWSTVHDVVASAGIHEWAAATSYLVVLVFVAVDLAGAARRHPDGTRRRHREATTAVSMAAGAFVVGIGYTVVFAGLWTLVGQAAPTSVVELWDRHPGAGFVVAFVAWDLSGWCYHWLGHHTRIGWAGHQAHHSGTDYNGSLALRLSWTPFIGLAHHPLLALAGFDLTTVIVCAALSNTLQALQHTSHPVRVPLAVRAVVMTPMAHRHHHLRSGGAENLGPVFTVWDRLAGSWNGTDVPEGATYGAVDQGHVGRPSAEWNGWVDLVARRVRRTSAWLTVR